jgi:hypothetical protein
VTPEQTDEIIELLRKVRDVVDACPTFEDVASIRIGRSTVQTRCGAILLVERFLPGELGLMVEGVIKADDPLGDKRIGPLMAVSLRDVVEVFP